MKKPKRRGKTPSRAARAKAAKKRRRRQAGKSGSKVNNRQVQRRATRKLHDDLNAIHTEFIGKKIRSISLQGDTRTISITMDDGVGSQPVAFIIHGVDAVAVGDVQSVAVPDTQDDGDGQMTEGGIALPPGVEA